MHKLNRNFGEWLRKNLEDVNMSQSELARRAGITRSWVSGIISGKRNPGNNTLLAIARVLNLPPDEIFRAAGYTEGSAKNVEMLSYKFALLPEREQDDVLDYVDMKLRQQERNHTKGDDYATTSNCNR